MLSNLKFHMNLFKRALKLNFFLDKFFAHLVFDVIFNFQYCKLASSNTSCLEAYAGFFRLLMKGIFDGYVLYLLAKNILVTRFSTRDSTVYHLVHQ